MKAWSGRHCDDPDAWISRERMIQRPQDQHVAVRGGAHPVSWFPHLGGRVSTYHERRLTDLDASR